MEVTTLAEAKQLHARILKSGLRQNAQNLSKLFTFAALSADRDLSYSRLILNSLTAPNSYYYNTMIRAYSRSPDPTHHSEAISLFLSMIHCPTHQTPPPDKFTFPVVLKSCARLSRTHLGKQLHGLIFKLGFSSDRFIQNSLIHMYSVCGESGLAYKVFDEMPEKDVVSWTSMIDGLVDDDRPVEAIRMFEKMLEVEVVVNDATIVSVLRACADSGALGVGRKVHGIVVERNAGLLDKANVSSALIDMYAKCGCIDSARRVFNEIVNKDVFAWTAMICSLASHGHCQEAIDLFHEMNSFNVNPDERTMVAVLSACRNAGWVSEGQAYFNDMWKKYEIRPTIQLYGCIVDLLARAGHLKDAEDFIRNMPIEPDDVMWRTLIWACKFHGDISRGERLMKHLGILKMGSADCGSYVLVGNVYASAGKWRDKARVRELMTERGLVKPAGSSRIEVDGAIHEFAVGDTSHVDAENIYTKLEEIEEQLRGQRHEPRLAEVLLEIDNEEKAFQLRHHSEKLAVAFGLIKTNPGSEIRIVKNLRSCEDCHEVMKLISRIYERDIVVRDRIRFHRFRNGECSCGNYW